MAKVKAWQVHFLVLWGINNIGDRNTDFILLVLIHSPTFCVQLHPSAGGSVRLRIPSSPFVCVLLEIFNDRHVYSLTRFGFFCFWKVCFFMFSVCKYRGVISLSQVEISYFELGMCSWFKFQSVSVE